MHINLRPARQPRPHSIQLPRQSSFNKHIQVAPSLLAVCTSKKRSWENIHTHFWDQFVNLTRRWSEDDLSEAARGEGSSLMARVGVIWCGPSLLRNTGNSGCANTRGGHLQTRAKVKAQALCCCCALLCKLHWSCWFSPPSRTAEPAHPQPKCSHQVFKAS